MYTVFKNIVLQLLIWSCSLTSLFRKRTESIDKYKVLNLFENYKKTKLSIYSLFCTSFSFLTVITKARRIISFLSLAFIYTDICYACLSLSSNITQRPPSLLLCIFKVPFSVKNTNRKQKCIKKNFPLNKIATWIIKLTYLFSGRTVAKKKLSYS